MLTTSARIPRGTSLTADVAVVGAGAAGITLARELAGTDLRVVVLETGGLEPDADETELARVQSTGAEYPADFSRLRYFGGTTGHWGGWCRPFDEWAMPRRAWVGDAAWPIAFSELAAYDERAREVVELPAPPEGWRWDWPYWRAAVGDLGYETLIDDESVTNTLYRFSPPTRFGTRYRDELARAGNVTVVTGAHALRLDDDGRRVTGIPVASLDGNRFEVRARVVVVAVGGLEVPRLLLLSDRTRPAGLGNDHDLVGRYFMDHHEGSVGTLETARDLPLYQGGSLAGVRALLHLTPTVMAREQLLGCAVSLDNSAVGVGELADEETGVTAAMVSGLRRGVTGGPSATLNVTVRGEPRPDPESRVVLGDERDALGQRRLELRYTAASDDDASMRRSLELLGQRLGAAGIGRLRVNPDDAPRIQDTIAIFGFHHMGTARMASDPRSGVVDGNLRVHGTDNCYVASSAVFPTAGTTNPTFTIVTLTLRLADHLRRVLA